MTLLPHWKHGSKFRRYLHLPKPLDEATCARLTARVMALPNVQPYIRWQTHGGVILVPKRNDLERFFLLPQEKVMYARTARCDEHDPAMVLVLRAIVTELHLMEYEQRLKPYSLGKAMCDDCGVHDKHRSRRDTRALYPAQDGSPCAPWQGVKYNVLYGA